MKLRSLQDRLVSAIGDGELPPRLARETKGRRRGDAAAGVRQYLALRRGARAAALAAAFPVTRQILGTSGWSRLLGHSGLETRHDADDLNRYGGWLPGVVASAPAPDRPPWLAELARLEWAVHGARLAGDDTAPDWEALRRLDPARQAGTRIRPSQSLSLHDCRWCVDTVWQDPSGAPPDPGPVTVVVHRAGRFDVGVTRIRPDDRALLCRVLEGARLGELDTASTGRLFTWFRQGWLAGFDHG